MSAVTVVVGKVRSPYTSASEANYAFHCSAKGILRIWHLCRILCLLQMRFHQKGHSPPLEPRGPQWRRRFSPVSSDCPSTNHRGPPLVAPELVMPVIECVDVDCVCSILIWRMSLHDEIKVCSFMLAASCTLHRRTKTRPNQTFVLLFLCGKMTYPFKTAN